MLKDGAGIHAYTGLSVHFRLALKLSELNALESVFACMPGWAS